MAIMEAQKHVDNKETVKGLWALGHAQLAAKKFEEAVRTFRRAEEIAVRNTTRVSCATVTPLGVSVFSCVFFVCFSCIIAERREEGYSAKG